jgi:hypothetical protein
VRVFDARRATYPSLLARGMLRAAAARCEFVNVSVSLPPGPGDDALVDACSAIVDAGCVIVASARADRPGWLPASLPGVHAVVADDSLADGDVRETGERTLAARGRPRALAVVPAHENFGGASFASARALAHLARRRIGAG